MSGITLTSTQTATLQSLSSASALFNTTQNELNTGKKVNTAYNAETLAPVANPEAGEN